MCNGSLVINDDYLLVCNNPNCGIIYKNIVDESAEWRYYGSNDNNSDPTRCGLPINPLLQESSYGCKVMCSGNSSYEMRKIRRYTAWQSMPYREKSNYDDFQHIITMASNAGIPKIIIDEALRYHKIIIKEKTFRGINREGVIAASIYIASRLHEHPRTPKELATIFNLNNTNATKGCKNAMIILNSIESKLTSKEKTQFIATKPEAFIERFCSKLNYSEELIKLCIFVAMRVNKNGLVPEKAPQSVAAGIIYFIAKICKINISKLDIYNISQISEVTINKTYKELEKHTNTLIPSVILNKYTS